MTVWDSMVYELAKDTEDVFLTERERRYDNEDDWDDDYDDDEDEY